MFSFIRKWLFPIAENSLFQDGEISKKQRKKRRCEKIQIFLRQEQFIKLRVKEKKLKNILHSVLNMLTALLSTQRNFCYMLILKSERF